MVVCDGGGGGFYLWGGVVWFDVFGVGVYVGGVGLCVVVCRVGVVVCRFGVGCDDYVGWMVD